MWAASPTESLRLLLTEQPPPFSREAFGVVGSVDREYRVPEKNNPPEGGTGSLSAVRKIVSLR